MSKFFLLSSLLKAVINKGTHSVAAYVSQEGYGNLVVEFTRLESIERLEAPTAIAEARNKGDLSGNSEYGVAKEVQAHLEDKTNGMKLTIAEAKVADMSRLSADTVQILSKVEMANTKTKSKMVCTIANESEADLKAGKISIKMPIAQGLLSKKEGNEVDIKIPTDAIELRIDKITVG